jgi:hypothetical protein
MATNLKQMSGEKSKTFKIDDILGKPHKLSKNQSDNRKNNITIIKNEIIKNNSERKEMKIETLLKNEISKGIKFEHDKVPDGIEIEHLKESMQCEELYELLKDLEKKTNEQKKEIKLYLWKKYYLTVLRNIEY